MTALAYRYGAFRRNMCENEKSGLFGAGEGPRDPLLVFELWMRLQFPLVEISEKSYDPESTAGSRAQHCGIPTVLKNAAQ